MKIPDSLKEKLKGIDLEELEREIHWLVEYRASKDGHLRREAVPCN